MIIGLLIFIAIMGYVSYNINRKYQTSKEGYLLAGRDLSIFDITMSITASWTFALGVLMISFFTFTKGAAGWTWFVVPQLGGLALMALLAWNILKKMPNGFTTIQFVRERYKDKRVTAFFQLVAILGVLNALIGNLTALGNISAYMSGGLVSYEVLVCVMSLGILGYTLWGGLKSSVATDKVQTGFLVLLAVFGFGSWIAYGNPEGISATLSSVEGASPVFGSIMYAMGANLLMLMSASLVNDNGLYQRVLAVKDKARAWQGFVWAGALFTVIALGIGALAATGIHTGVEVVDGKLSTTATLEALFGGVGLIIMTLAILSASASTIDTAYNSFGAMVANDMLPNNEDPVRTSRLAMCGLFIFVTAVALFKIDIWIIFTTFALLRLITVAPMVIGIVSNWSFNTTPILIGIGLALVYALCVKTGNALPLSGTTNNLIVLLLPALGTFLAIRKEHT